MRVTESSLNVKAATFPLLEASTKTRIKSIYLDRYEITISDYKLLLMRLIVIRFMHFFFQNVTELFWKLCLHCKPIPWNENRISMCSHFYPVIIALKGPCFHYRDPVFITGISLQNPVLTCMGLQCSIEAIKLLFVYFFAVSTLCFNFFQFVFLVSIIAQKLFNWILFVPKNAGLAVQIMYQPFKVQWQISKVI